MRPFFASPTVKFFLIALLILILMVPLLFVFALIADRESRARQVAREVARIWGSPQQVTGPFLVVPYKAKVSVWQKDKMVEKFVERRMMVLPEKLGVIAAAETRKLRRSIYDVTVYQADVQLSGTFAAMDLTKIDPQAVAIRWQDAVLTILLNDVSGLKSATPLKVTPDGHARTVQNTQSAAFEPSPGFQGTSYRGIHARISNALPDPYPPGTLTSPGDDAVQPEQVTVTPAFAFTTRFSFNGSGSLQFTPVARTTKVNIASGWPHPGFIGAFLPEQRSVTPKGFNAKWQVPHLARSVPQAQRLHQRFGNPFGRYSFGVRFFIPLDYYTLVNRSVKYGIMFLAVAFSAVFILELFSKVRVHAVQYVFVGLAMIFFFVLLLSLAEHLGFNTAYFIAAAATGTMLSIYVGMVLGSRDSAMMMAGVFMALYGLLYLILRLEDYALLAGALSGFAMLTAVMFLTLRIDWSGRQQSGTIYK